MTTNRWRSKLGLVVAAPWFAEIARGGIPVTDVPLVLLFREVVRRSGRGGPSMLLIAGASGVMQAGVVDQSLFNPAYGRRPWLGRREVPVVAAVICLLGVLATWWRLRALTRIDRGPATSGP